MRHGSGVLGDGKEVGDLGHGGGGKRTFLQGAEIVADLALGLEAGNGHGLGRARENPAQRALRQRAAAAAQEFAHGIEPEPKMPSGVRPAEGPPPNMPRGFISVPTASATSYMPLFTAMNASRTAVAPEAQALETLTQGMPVWPISRMICWLIEAPAVKPDPV